MSLWNRQNIGAQSERLKLRHIADASVTEVMPSGIPGRHSYFKNKM
jgi:hypothetical protein